MAPGAGTVAGGVMVANLATNVTEPGAKMWLLSDPLVAALMRIS